MSEHTIDNVHPIHALLEPADPGGCSPAMVVAGDGEDPTVAYAAGETLTLFDLEDGEVRARTAPELARVRRQRWQRLLEEFGDDLADFLDLDTEAVFILRRALRTGDPVFRDGFYALTHPRTRPERTAREAFNGRTDHGDRTFDPGKQQRPGGCATSAKTLAALFGGAEPWVRTILQRRLDRGLSLAFYGHRSLSALRRDIAWLRWSFAGDGGQDGAHVLLRTFGAPDADIPALLPPASLLGAYDQAGPLPLITMVLGCAQVPGRTEAGVGAAVDHGSGRSLSARVDAAARSAS